MTRTMYDSTRPDDIPPDAEMVAYYVDGKYTWPQAWIDRFPNAVKVSISAIGMKSAMVGDVEEGCIWPPENAVDWVLDARRNGFDPTIYCNQLNHWQWIAAEFEHRNVPMDKWWVANYDGNSTIPAGAVAKQYKHPPQIGKHYDLSAVADYWPGVDTTEGDDMAGEGPNILAFLATGGPSTRVKDNDELKVQGVDPTSMFGRLADVQWALTETLPIVPQINERLFAMGNAISREIDANEAFRVEMRAAITAAPAGGALDVERVSQRVTELLAQRLAD